MSARVRGTGDVVRERGRREDTDGDSACDEAGHPCLFHLHNMFSPFGLGINQHSVTRPLHIKACSPQR